MNKIVVIGAGLVGSFVVNELSKKYNVFAIDPNKESLNNCNIPDENKINKNFHIDSITEINPDIVVNAVPGFLGYSTLKAIIESGFNCVDFSFMPENPTTLHDLAKERNVSVITDMGVAPGLCHLFAEDLYQKLGSEATIEIAVGGLPKDINDDYKAVFSPCDVIEEYMRPARFIEDGKIIYEIPFNTEYHNEDYGDNIVGFASDGLRTLLDNIKVKNLAEYTLRYKEHFRDMKAFLKYDMFNPSILLAISPLLKKKWKMPKDFKDITIMIVAGFCDSEDPITVHVIEDEAKDGYHSMARTTGVPVIASVEYFLSNRINSGVYPPELFLRDNKDFLKFVLSRIRNYSIKYKRIVR